MIRNSFLPLGGPIRLPQAKQASNHPSNNPMIPAQRFGMNWADFDDVPSPEPAVPTDSAPWTYGVRKEFLEETGHFYPNAQQVSAKKEVEIGMITGAITSLFIKIKRVQDLLRNAALKLEGELALRGDRQKNERAIIPMDVPGYESSNQETYPFWLEKLPGDGEPLYSMEYRSQKNRLTVGRIQIPFHIREGVPEYPMEDVMAAGQRRMRILPALKQPQQDSFVQLFLNPPKQAGFLRPDPEASPKVKPEDLLPKELRESGSPSPNPESQRSPRALERGSIAEVGVCNPVVTLQETLELLSEFQQVLNRKTFDSPAVTG